MSVIDFSYSFCCKINHLRAITHWFLSLLKSSWKRCEYNPALSSPVTEQPLLVISGRHCHCPPSFSFSKVRVMCTSRTTTQPRHSCDHKPPNMPPCTDLHQHYTKHMFPISFLPINVCLFKVFWAHFYPWFPISTSLGSWSCLFPHILGFSFHLSWDCCSRGV